MTTQEAREVFNQALNNEVDPDKRANIELCREFFTNPKFRQWMSDTVYSLVSAEGA